MSSFILTFTFYKILIGIAWINWQLGIILITLHSFEGPRDQRFESQHRQHLSRLKLVIPDSCQAHFKALGFVRNWDESPDHKVASTLDLLMCDCGPINVLSAFKS